MFSLEAGPAKIIRTARQKSVKGLAEVMTFKRRETKGLVFRKDLMISKALAIDVALADASRRKRLVVRAFD